ncbi:hypothetical protein E4U31_003824 [Claviceps sp. LM219 group G6]|nr:hypothetical protein E4U15_002078 [Claviceps sp. LM218 group G6]KAG6114485.1 hypothetical protein E4U31_003824 [Claviceps sp. LM219 group G6]
MASSNKLISNNVASSFLLVDEGGDGSDMLQAKVKHLARGRLQARQAVAGSTGEGLNLADWLATVWWEI